MRLAMLVIALASCATISLAAPYPTCHFNREKVVTCLVEENAADAYYHIEMSGADLNSAYNQRLLKHAGCQILGGADTAKVRMARVHSIRIPEPAGSSVRVFWLDVVTPTRDLLLWIAEGYLEGTCPRAVWPTNSAPSLYRAKDTDEIHCDTEAATAIIRRGVLNPDAISDRDFMSIRDEHSCVARPDPDASGHHL